VGFPLSAFRAISAPTDSNVGSEVRRGRENPRGTRRSCLAQLLLSSLFVLPMLSMSACIIPIGPDFQDPSASANYPPYIESFTPDFNSITTPPSPLSFSVTVTDPNLGDDLYVEWFADYPGINYRLVAQTMIAHSMNGQPLHQPVSATVDCVGDHLLQTPNGDHRIEVIIADRPFSQMVPPTVAPPGFIIYASWAIEQLSCPSQ